jgi:Xaa-Pro aminopeptidase
MAVTEQTVVLTAQTVERIQEELRARSLDGWLLYDFRGMNPVAGALLGLPALTRRYFVLVPAAGTPIALTHRIEQQPWSTWHGEKRVYSSWREIETELKSMLGGVRRVAMEYTAGDAVPVVDRVPAGVVEMVRAAGAEPEGSGDLISYFTARWSDEGEASHRRASVAVRETAHAAFERITAAIRAGERTSEWEVRQWIGEELLRRGLTVGGDTIVAVNANAANAHYAPSAEHHSEIRAGDLVLIDLWGKENEEAIYADQTWMAYVGETIPERLETIFGTLVDAREAACAMVIDRFAAGNAVAGFEVDDVSRGIIEARGYGEQFIHRTGHSIDRELHGSGPNIDNLETRDTRTLIPGIGFSVEPGIYLEGDVGFRSEVNMFIGPNGPEVTTDRPQKKLYALLADDPFGG